MEDGSPKEGSELVTKSREDILNLKQSDEARTANKAKEAEFKSVHRRLIGFLTLLIVLHVIGIYLFTSGFLLSRLVLDDKSECSTPPIELYGNHQPGSASTGCWHPKTFDKAVVIIIDALRYDFTVPFQPTQGDTKPHHFHNAFPILHHTAVNKPQHAVLRPFIADPPTTTLQRLKGLTVGTLPTFIDAGSNFAGTAIEEDNLIDQLKTAGKEVVHLGDDTWHSLFPDRFNAELTRPFDSFNVWDLHTVDNGVSTHLFPLLHSSNTTKWDFIIGHYLGLDHAGHEYGPDHPAMTAKIKQMNDVVERAIDLIDEDTLLVVMGDHGMDPKGDHGGESDNEVEAALWMYSKRNIFGRSSVEAMRPPSTAKERPVAQIDLVPTLALLLGIPIPYENLGGPIEEAFIGPGGDAFENLALVNRITAAQVHRYQEDYAVVRQPNPDDTAVPEMLWDAATRAWDSRINSSKKIQDSHWKNLAGSFLSYQRHNLSMCRALWARFNLISIAEGIVVLLLVLLVVIVFARSPRNDMMDVTTTLFLRGLVLLALGGAAGYFVAQITPGLNSIGTTMFFAGFASSTTLIHTLYIQNLLHIPLPTSFWSIFCFIFVLLLSGGFGSNSFTVWEDEILLFFLATLGFFLFVQSFRLEKVLDRILGCYHSAIFLIMIRLASLSRLCREEQMPFCKSTFYASATSSTAAPWQLIIPFLIATTLPTTIKTYYQQTSSYQGSGPFWIGIAFRITLLFVTLFWTLETADHNDWSSMSKDSLKTIRMYIAQLVFAITVGAGIATFGWQAPLIGIERIKPRAWSKTVTSDNTSDAARESESRPQIVVQGTNNLYGSHFAILPFTILFLPLLLVQKPMGQAALTMVSIAMLSLFELLWLLNLSRPQTGTNNEHRIATVGPVALALLGHFAYFKTGHQAALASIQWDTAFIALRTLRYPWSPLLVILNTMAGQILTAAAVPCVVLWRRPFNFSDSSKSSTSSIPIPEVAPAPSGASSRRRVLLSDLAKAQLTHLIVYSVINVATTVFAGHLRRHLMLYRVFCPRWMLGTAGIIVSELVGCFIGIGGVAWTVGSLSGLFGW